MRGQAGDLKNIAARKQLKANAIKKLIFCGLFLALILGFASAALAQEFVDDFDDLERILTADYSSPTELTVQISEDKDIYLDGAIKVNRNVTKLTIDLNGRTIDGAGKYPFLQFDGTCDLTLTNTSTDTSETGEIQNCSGDDGAVIYFGNVNDVKITLQNIVFRDNVAEYGGGGVVYAGGSNCTFTAKGCVFENNGAGWMHGGAIYLYDSSTCNISYCKFSNNYAEEFGGALSAGADNTINISHCSFKNNFSNYNDGGAVHVGDSTILQVNNTVFSDNDAYGQGGAIWQGDSVEEKIGTGVLKIENCKFDLNDADDFGGAVQTKALKEIVINNSDFTYNESDYGGAVGIFGTKATLKSCVFSHNEAYSYGGAICNDSLDLGVDGCNFTENSAYAGGAIADPFYRFLTLIQGSYEVDESDVVHNSEIKNSTFSKNTAENGGAVFESTGVGNEQYYFDEQKGLGYYLTSDDDDGYEPGIKIYLTSTPGNHVKIINSQFLENEAAKCGGAVYVDNPLDTVISGGNTRIEKNKAGTSGGAVYVVNSGTYAIDGAPFTDNTDETKNTAPIGKDISLYDDSTIMVAGNLGTNVYDVAKYDFGIHRPGVITSGLSGKGTKENFKSSEGYGVIINSNNEAELVSAYTVTFQSNGGSGNMEEQVIPTGTTQNLTGNTFEREHYIFKEWNTSADGTGTPYEDKASISLSNNLTLYAQWEAEEVYSINTSAANGTVTLNKKDAYSNDTISFTVSPDTGYALARLSYDPSSLQANLSNGTYSFTMPAANVTITAVFEAIPYSVTVNGGTAKIWRNDGWIQITQAKAGDTVFVDVDISSIPDGHYCSAMTSDQVTLTEELAPGEWSFEMPAQPVTVTAQYSRQAEKTYDLTGADLHPVIEDEVLEQVNNENDHPQYDILHPDDTTKPYEYDFNGDNKADVSIDRDSHAASCGEGANDLDHDPVLTFPGLHYSPITFLLPGRYAVTVTNGTGSGDYVKGESVTITATVPEGKRFQEWTGVDGLTFTTGSGATESAVFVMPPRNVDVSAAFETNKYTIQFVNEDGGVLQSGEVEHGAMPVYTEETPLKAEDEQYTYTFAGWTPEITAATGAAVYTASYTPVKRSYTITWQMDDGSVIDTTTVGYGAVPTHDAPVKESDADYIYTFSKWTPDPVSVSGPATYKAQFTATAKKVYTVILSSDGNGAASADPASGTEGTGVTLTATPKEGYRFKEWQVITGGVIITDNKFSIERENVELKAIFELTAPKKYAFTKGDGSSWTKGSGTPLDFTVKGSPDDTATFQNFTGIDVDGKAVAGWGYTTAPGSVNISLIPGYLEDMTPGIHKITANFTDGSAVASFTVNYKVPKTGDEGNPMLWLGCVLAGSVMIAVFVYAEKRKKTVSK